MQSLRNNRQKTKGQHYIPRFYLKRFSTERNGEYYIWCYNLKTCKIFEANISKVCKENWFYDRHNIFEDGLSMLEGKFYSKIYEIIQNKPISSLSTKEKQIIAEFMYTQDTRTRRARDITIGIYEDVINNDEFKNWFQKEFPNITIEEHLEEKRRYIQISEMFNIEISYNKPQFLESLGKIMNFDLFLLENDIDITGMEFYTSDHPVCIFNLSEKIEIKIVFPITPELCLMFTNDKQWELDHSSHRTIINKKFVEVANERTVLKANQFIFSKTNDFKFVERVLNTHDE